MHPPNFADQASTVSPLRPTENPEEPYEEMAAYAATVPIAKNPRLKLVVGAIEQDKCKLASDTEALEHCDRALDGGPYWEFLFEKGKALEKAGRYDEGLKAFELALAERPQKAEVHAHRAYVLFKLSRRAEAEAATTLAGAIDPTVSRSRTRK